MGTVSEDWRVANVVPLFKKGCKRQPGNYRQVRKKGLGPKYQLSYSSDAAWPAVFIQLDTLLPTDDVNMVGPGEIVGDHHSQELDTLDHLHLSTIDTDRSVLSTLLPE
eukprot:g39724.t1